MDEEQNKNFEDRMMRDLLYATQSTVPEDSGEYNITELTQQDIPNHTIEKEIFGLKEGEQCNQSKD